MYSVTGFIFSEAMNVHAGFSKYIMPKIMSGIFNKTVEEIKSEEPETILGANIVELEEDT